MEDPQRDLIDPAVKGTVNVLSSVVKHKDTVQRTIVTSSVAGKLVGGQPQVSQTPFPKQPCALLQLYLGMRVQWHPKMAHYTVRTTGTKPPALKTMKLTGRVKCVTPLAACWHILTRQHVPFLLLFCVPAPGVSSGPIHGGFCTSPAVRSYHRLHMCRSSFGLHSRVLTYNHVFGRHLQSERHGRQPRNMGWILSQYCPISFWVLHCHVKRPKA